MWVCCQLGAREHYAVARALVTRGVLAALVTDAWVPPGHPLGRLRRSLRERYHADLAEVPVHAANAGLLAFELSTRVRGLQGWSRILARNRWFQRHAVRSLERQESEIENRKSEITTVFAYSYAALEIFRRAKTRGWRTVLGQIDPGPGEERLVMRLEANGGASSHWRPAPAQYWRAWHAECELADRIVVNSHWSLRLMAEEGIPDAKLRVVPLAYAGHVGSPEAVRAMPLQFSAERPLRVLFLGQINLRKGVVPILEAVWEMENEPVEFWFVGAEQIRIPPDLRFHPKVRWYGPVARGAAEAFYRQADVFLFPTCSDGFGLTQLEAQALGLPVIASRHCGEVVTDGVNGLLLPEVSATAIAAAVRRCLAEPGLLTRLAANSRVDERFSLRSVGDQLLSLF